MFSTCPICNYSTDPSINACGSLLIVTQICNGCNCRRKWESQPKINGTPAGNLLLSAAILFAGALPTKTLRVLEFLNCAAISKTTYFCHQKLFLLPTILKVWSEHQLNMVSVLQAFGEPLMLGGDGRSDSPGHSAKYGSYTFMDLIHNVILDVELVQVHNSLNPCIS